RMYDCETFVLLMVLEKQRYPGKRSLLAEGHRQRSKRGLPHELEKLPAWRPGPVELGPANTHSVPEVSSGFDSASVAMREYWGAWLEFGMASAWPSEAFLALSAKLA